MYQVQRKGRIKEELQLLNADGSVAHTIEVDLDVDTIATRVKKAYEALGMAQNALQNNQTPQMMESYGKAVEGILDVIFGENGCGKILEFYENNYTEMLLDLFPFINDVIMPQIKKASAARKQQLIAAAKATKQ